MAYTVDQLKAMAREELGAKATDAEVLNRALAMASEAVKVAEAKASGIAAKLTLRVSPKGALSVYGLGQWPVTLYREQWNRLLHEADAIKAFIVANGGALKAKGDAPKADAAKTA